MRPLVLVPSLVAALSAALSAGKGSAHSAEPRVSAGCGEARRNLELSVHRMRTVFAGGLFTELIDDFHKKTDYSVQVYVSRIPMNKQRPEEPTWSSHISDASIGAFVSDGFGLWPVPVAANVTAFLVPPGHAARVRNLSNPPGNLSQDCAREVTFSSKRRSEHEVSDRHPLACGWPPRQGPVVHGFASGG